MPNIEKPVFHRPIDTTPSQRTSFADLAKKYAEATTDVSSFHGLRSFESYAEIVRRGSVVRPAIAQNLVNYPSRIGLVLAFEDIQANLAAEGFKIDQITEGAEELAEKRERILGWAEKESIIGIRSKKERMRVGLRLYGSMEQSALRVMTPVQRKQYDRPEYAEGTVQRAIDLVLPGGQEVTVLATSKGHQSRSTGSLNIIDRTESSNVYTVGLIYTDGGKRIIDATFDGEEFPSNTRGAAKEITRAVQRLFGYDNAPLERVA